MSVLIDTSVWSLSLRRQPRQLNGFEQRLVKEWADLVGSGQVQIIGPIRQELLSGVRRTSDFESLRERLSSFEDILLFSADYERAAHFFNQCRTKGVTGTPIDLLLCAVAHREDLAIFTTDADFKNYAKHLPIRLHRLPA